MADHRAHRPAVTTRRRRAWRRLKRSRYARHLPFTIYCLITFGGMGWTLTMICRATG